MVELPGIIKLGDCEQFTTKDGSRIREIMAPRNSIIKKQSLAEAVVSIGGETEEHYHATSEEIYFIMRGMGEMTVAEKEFRVEPGDAVALPPGTRHKIKNVGNEDLMFLCICVPSYEHGDTVITEER
jgi:mannose-6-phosphate isomerase-like protein (cupin superfamily)